MALAAVAVANIGLTQDGGVPKSALSFKERRLAVLPETLKVGEDPFFLSPDMNTLVYRGERGGMEFWVVGKTKGEEFEKLEELIFSPDGKTVAYAAEKGGKSFIVVGDKKTEAFDKIICNPTFSPDGKTVAFRAEKGEESFVGVGDRRIHVGGAGQALLPLGSPVFSPDGKSLAYVDCKGAKFFVVVGDKKGEEFDSVDADTLTFTRDGRSVAYLAGNNGKKFVVVEGKKGDDFDLVRSLAVTSDGSKVAYVARKNGKEFVVLGAEGGEEFERVEHLTLGPDGKTVAYWAFVDDHSFVVLGEKKSNKSPFPQGIPASGISVSPDCKTIAYITMTGEQTACLMVGTERSKDFDVAHHTAVSRPIFSPDGRVLAYIYADPKLEKTCLVVGGKRVGEFDNPLWAMTFSPDSRMLGYLAIQGRELWWKVIGLK